MPGLFERLFGSPRAVARDYRQGPKLAGLDPISERCVALQKAYWAPAPAELAQLEAIAFEQLRGPELLRLHHLRILALLDARDAVLRRGLLAPAAERPLAEDLAVATDPALLAKVEASAKALVRRRSSYRPRHGFVWTGAGAPETDEVPYSDFQGRLVNASLSHLGSLEIIRLDERFEPAALEFLDFDQILTISLGATEAGDRAPFRPARILREYGREELVVLLPLRYGLSWLAHEVELLRGHAEHRVAAIELTGLAAPDRAIGNPHDARELGVEVGLQRLEVLSDYSEDGDRGLSRFTLADAYQISLAIDQDDPRFTDKCRGRGLDPEATRGDVVRESRLRASARAARKR
jgi:hypothetical protein